MRVPFTHLLAMSDHIGTFEHASHRTPRVEHGYCVDDVARDLLAVCAESSRPPLLADLDQISLRFVMDAEDRRRRADRPDAGGLEEMAHTGNEFRPVDGWRPPRTGRVVAVARAARRAFEATYDQRWVDVVGSRARWFDGLNDASQMMWDPLTGAGFDVLHAGSVNQNCGAESTLAVMSTMQQFSAVDEMVA